MDIGVWRPSGSCLRLTLGEQATFCDLKALLKMILGIRKSRRRLAVDSTIVSSRQALGSVVRSTPLEVTLVVVEPVCSPCGADGPLLFCGGVCRHPVLRRSVPKGRLAEAQGALQTS